jgi:hypothetical protein
MLLEGDPEGVGRNPYVAITVPTASGICVVLHVLQICPVAKRWLGSGKPGVRVDPHPMPTAKPTVVPLNC